MEFAHENAGDVVVAKLAGRLDSSSASTAEEQLSRLIPNSAPRLVIDLSNLEYISSAGLRSLMIASKAGTPRGVKLGVSAMQPIVKEIFTIIRFHLVFACFDTVRQAIDKLDPSALAAYDAS